MTATKTDIQQLKTYQEGFKQAKQNGESVQHVCPNCGYCPSCGRRYPYYPAPYYVPYVPSNPVYPTYPQSPIPIWKWESPVVTITNARVPITNTGGNYSSYAVGKNDFKVG